MTDLSSAHAARCPFDHTPQGASDRKSSRAGEALTPPFEVDGERWTIRSFRLARSILRDSQATRQAGFSAETLEHAARRMRPPILYQEGAGHKAQRTATARFFTPQTVGRDYRALMEALSGELVADLKARGEADLSTLSMKLSVRVVAQVVGLTSASPRALGRRLETFFEDDPTRFSWRPDKLWRFLRTQSALLRFFYQDVKPAIRARRQAPREDVISHLLEKGYNDAEILTECVTYAAAGMLPTREFIVMAAWHLLENEPLQRHYLTADEAGRQRVLGEILRLEPVVGYLYRRTVRPLTLVHGARRSRSPPGRFSTSTCAWSTPMPRPSVKRPYSSARPAR